MNLLPSGGIFVGSLLSRRGRPSHSTFKELWAPQGWKRFQEEAAGKCAPGAKQDSEKEVGQFHKWAAWLLSVHGSLKIPPPSSRDNMKEERRWVTLSKLLGFSTSFAVK